MLNTQGSIGASSLVAQLVKNPSAMQESQLDPWVRKISWRKDRLPTPVFLGFSDSSDSKESTCNVGNLGSSPGLGRSPVEEDGNPLQYSCLENSMDRGAWQATEHGVTKSRTQLSNFCLYFFTYEHIANKSFFK